MSKKILLILIVFFFSSKAYAHFLTLLSDDFFISNPKPVKVEVLFTHPIEQGPHMSFHIESSYITCSGVKKSLEFKERHLPPVKGVKGKSYNTILNITEPSLCNVIVIQSPYFEKSEQKYIQQIAKGVFSFYGLEEGWDNPLGLPVEIVPLIKPFALYEGNTFKGRVLVDGKPASGIEIEVEFWNEKHFKVPHNGFLPQVIKSDDNGYFEFTFPWAGLWGFSVITEKGTFKSPNYGEHPLELDGVFWLKVYPKPKGK